MSSVPFVPSPSCFCDPNGPCTCRQTSLAVTEPQPSAFLPYYQHQYYGSGLSVSTGLQNWAGPAPGQYPTHPGYLPFIPGAYPPLAGTSGPALQDATGAVLNAPAGPNQQISNAASQDSSTHTGGRKRKGTASGGRSVAKRSRTTQAPQPTTVTVAPVVGVGPSSAPPAPEASSPLPERPIEQFHSVRSSSERNDDESSHSARDVWYFARALDSEVKPDVEPNPHEEPRLMKKPKTKWVGCKPCGSKWKVFKNGEGITSTFRNHLMAKHNEVYEESCATLGLRLGARKTSVSANMTAPCELFTQEGFMARLLRWIVVDDQSINVLECPEFRELILYLNQDVDDKDLPHRDKVRELIMKEYQKAYNKMTKELQDCLGRVSFTCDLWSNRELVSFMALTAHCVVEDDHGAKLNGRSYLLSFCEVEGSHTGAHIAEIIFKLIDKAGLKHKIGTFTCDNASNNNTFLDELKHMLEREGIPFHREGNRIRCFPHVVNLAVKQILNELKYNPVIPILESSGDPSELSSLDRYAKALEGDPVRKSRELVAACRASGQRRKDLKKLIVEGNESGHWKQDLGRNIPPVQLLRDCETRWSSTFLMVDRMLLLYPALKAFLAHPARSDIASHLLLPDEHTVLSDIFQVLELPHEAQELLSAEKTPAVSVAMPAYELLRDAWLNIGSTVPRMAHYAKVGVEKLDEYILMSRTSRIFALSMILNPVMKLKWIEEHWSTEEAVQARKWMINGMLEYRVDERKRRAAVQNARQTLQRSASVPSTNADRAAEAQDRGFSRLLSRVQRTASAPPSGSSSPDPSSSAGRNLSLVISAAEEEVARAAQDRAIVEAEFIKYIGEEPDNTSISTKNLYRYWALNKFKFPYMYRVALDVLPAQASAVSCERMFSSAKETDTLRRNRLKPETMEALQVLKYHYKQAQLDFADHLLAREEDYTIEGPLTEAAVIELLDAGKYDELRDLIRNCNDTSDDDTVAP